MKSLKFTASIILSAVMITVSSSVVFAEGDTPKISRTEKSDIITSQATSLKIGSLAKNTEISSQSIPINYYIPSTYSSVEKGYVTGDGTLYNKDGNVVYKGAFLSFLLLN